MFLRSCEHFERLNCETKTAGKSKKFECYRVPLENRDYDLTTRKRVKRCPTMREKRFWKFRFRIVTAKMNEISRSAPNEQCTVPIQLPFFREGLFCEKMGRFHYPRKCLRKRREKNTDAKSTLGI